MQSITANSAADMNTKHYTLAQARATLPTVKRYMQEIQSARDEILRLRPEALRAALMALGLRVTLDTSADGLVRLIATKPA